MQRIGGLRLVLSAGIEHVPSGGQEGGELTCNSRRGRGRTTFIISGLKRKKWSARSKKGGDGLLFLIPGKEIKTVHPLGMLMMDLKDNQ